MPTKTTRDASGRIISQKIESDLTDDDMADRASKEKLQDARGLGAYKPKAAVAETDPGKMSPLALAAYQEAQKKKLKKVSRGVTTDDAAAALGRRRA